MRWICFHVQFPCMLATLITHVSWPHQWNLMFWVKLNYYSCMKSGCVSSSKIPNSSEHSQVSTCYLSKFRSQFSVFYVLLLCIKENMLSRWRPVNKVETFAPLNTFLLSYVDCNYLIKYWNTSKMFRKNYVILTPTCRLKHVMWVSHGARYEHDCYMGRGALQVSRLASLKLHKGISVRMGCHCSLAK